MSMFIIHFQSQFYGHEDDPKKVVVLFGAQKGLNTSGIRIISNGIVE